MSLGDPNGEPRNARVVFGDCTNRPGKRGISCVSDELGGGSCSRKEKGVVVGAKQVPFGKENSGVEEGLSLMKDKGTHGLLSGIVDVRMARKIQNLPELPGEEEMHTHSLGDPGDMGEDSRTGSLLEGGDVSKDSCGSIISASRAQASGRTVYQVGDHGMDTIEVTPGSLVQEATVGGGGYIDFWMGSNDPLKGNIRPSTLGSIEGFQSSRFLGSKSYDFKGDQCVNQSPGDDLLKTCSCSVCLTAAYIWSDLHYQDIRGRLAALGKSRNEVASMIQRIDRAKSSVPHGPSGPDKTSKLESDLMNQWKSLFLHMQNALTQESSQSQVSYLELKDLREKCKIDMEAINRTSSMSPCICWLFIVLGSESLPFTCRLHQLVALTGTGNADRACHPPAVCLNTNGRSSIRNIHNS
ncbi:hypothetical protein MLD38_031293 [Melastoma candidum]|uniref:Uncharacterized protein n=1 Tax=Melastoma candidum TaxID=119954 RepID=A0ACB9MNN4_9MYRT|nr:hypothetical protein MLD38_031293 [Melastoma candidum]